MAVPWFMVEVPNYQASRESFALQRWPPFVPPWLSLLQRDRETDRFLWPCVQQRNRVASRFFSMVWITVPKVITTNLSSVDYQQHVLPTVQYVGAYVVQVLGSAMPSLSWLICRKRMAGRLLAETTQHSCSNYWLVMLPANIFVASSILSGFSLSTRATYVLHTLVLCTFVPQWHTITHHHPLTLRPPNKLFIMIFLGVENVQWMWQEFLSLLIIQCPILKRKNR